MVVKWWFRLLASMSKKASDYISSLNSSIDKHYHMYLSIYTYLLLPLTNLFLCNHIPSFLQGFQIGMTTSNEPGYYEEGNFGIRIETVCIAIEAHTPNTFNGKKSIALETVSLVPIATNLIIPSMLTPLEVQWLDVYHERVRKTILPLVTKDFPEAVQYLIDSTEPLSTVV